MEPSALFFVLFLLTVLTRLFSGAAFFLDRTRLPVFTSLLAVSLLTGVIRTDHKFVVCETNGAESKINPPNVIEAWKTNRSKGRKTAVVVATAGGGIRAAAWTAEVLTRLEEKDCRAVSDSLVLVSSVSRGSMGSMFVVAPYFGGEYPASDTDLKAVRFNTKRSSLAAVGWGLAYPDLARTSLVPQAFERGWSLENTWATPWREKKLSVPTMKQWREDTRRGLRPAVIFNGTASESGERFLVSSTDASFHGAKEFFSLFPTMAIDVTTAARLSASPLARASAGPVRKALNVRGSSQQVRESVELTMALEYLKSPTPDGNAEDADHPKGRAGSPLKVIPEPFLFSSAPDPDPPLSWHLTGPQKKEIRGAWASVDNQASWRKVRQALGCTVNMEILKNARESSEE